METVLENIRLVAGLGNPGEEYRNTRHNAGFQVVEKLLSSVFNRFEESHSAESRVFSGRFRGNPLILQMPLTYMNESGRAVALMSRRMNLNPSEILIISDDLDLPVGSIRIRKGGSDGGHNGLKSIIAELGGAGFNRLRVGIGRDEQKTVVDYVLTGFSAEEQPLWESAVNDAADAVVEILKSGMSRAMNRFNTRKKEALQEETNPNSQTI